MNITPEISRDTWGHLSDFNHNNLLDLWTSLSKYQFWKPVYDVTKGFDSDCSHHMIDLYTRLYVPSNLNVFHKEW